MWPGDATRLDRPEFEGGLRGLCPLRERLVLSGDWLRRWNWGALVRFHIRHSTTEGVLIGGRGKHPKKSMSKARTRPEVLVQSTQCERLFRTE